MSDTARFPFLPLAAGSGQSVFMPLLPIELRLPEGQAIQAHGLLDTGATVNVLPYSVGRRVGAVWERQDKIIPLAGNLASQEARALLLVARVGDFAPLQLVFAWTRSDDVPLLLGQVNFFHEFDANFFASQRLFEIRPATKR